MRYETAVTEVGPQVEEFVRAGMLVLFRDDAPEELRTFSVLHRPTTVAGGVTPGDVLQVGDRRLRVTAVGGVANNNLVELGHVVVKANGADEAPLPGDVCVERGELPDVPVGVRVAVVAGPAPAEGAGAPAGGPGTDERA